MESVKWEMCISFIREKSFAVGGWYSELMVPHTIILSSSYNKHIELIFQDMA